MSKRRTFERMRRREKQREASAAKRSIALLRGYEAAIDPSNADVVFKRQFNDKWIMHWTDSWLARAVAGQRHARLAPMTTEEKDQCLLEIVQRHPIELPILRVYEMQTWGFSASGRTTSRAPNLQGLPQRVSGSSP